MQTWGTRPYWLVSGTMSYESDVVYLERADRACRPSGHPASLPYSVLVSGGACLLRHHFAFRVKHSFATHRHRVDVRCLRNGVPRPARREKIAHNTNLCCKRCAEHRNQTPFAASPSFSFNKLHLAQNVNLKA